MNEPTMETLARRLDRVDRENRRLKRAGTWTLTVMAVVVLGILLRGASHLALGAEPPLGVWSDKEGKVTYAFLENQEFWFEQEETRYVKKEKWGYGKWERYKWAPEGIETVRYEGVWETGPDLCWLGKKGEGNNGNMVIFDESTSCCLQAHIIGKHFVLSKIWIKPRLETRLYCSNRLLIKAKPRP